MTDYPEPPTGLARRLINLKRERSKYLAWTRIQSIPEWVHHVAVVVAISATGIVFW